MELLIINGPNLNLLGKREPEVYGDTTLDDLEDRVREWATTMAVTVEWHQSNHEGEIVDLIQATSADGVIVNAGALTHTSHSIGDAIRSVDVPVVEVHISNVYEREPWRADSLIADACVRSIYGRGIGGYRDAVRHLVNRSAWEFETFRYGPHPDHVGDLRRGGGDLVVLAHGGIWRHEYERDTTESLAVDLASRGYDTWNIEYRRPGKGGGWPASAQDVLMALDSIPQLGVEARRVVVVGHSAGSHLLTWAAERTRTRVALHVALAPLLDLAGSARSDDACARESRMMIARGSPRVMTPRRVPTILVHGSADQIVPVERSDQLALEHDLELHRTGTDHFSLLDPSKPEWTWVTERIGSSDATGPGS